MPDSIPSITDLGIEPEAAARLLPHIDSFVKWELLRFLQDNSHVVASVEDLARYTGRDETELKPAARALVSAGLVVQSGEEANYMYSLTVDEHLRDMLGGLFEGFLGDRLIRLALSSHILKAQRRNRSLQYAAG